MLEPEPIVPKLYQATLELLENRPRKLYIKDIAKQTGLPEGWLRSLESGHVKDPSVNRIETLYIFLSGNKLDVER